MGDDQSPRRDEIARLQSELTRKTAEQRALSDHIVGLVIENARLTKQVAAIPQSANNPGKAPTSAEPRTQQDKEQHSRSSQADDDDNPKDAVPYSTYDALTKKYNGLRSSLEKTKKRTQELKEDLETRDRTVQELREDLGVRKTQLAIYAKANDELQKKLRSVKNSAHEWEAALNKLKEENRELKRQLIVGSITPASIITSDIDARVSVESSPSPSMPPPLAAEKSPGKGVSPETTFDRSDKISSSAKPLDNVGNSGGNAGMSQGRTEQGNLKRVDDLVSATANKLEECADDSPPEEKLLSSQATEGDPIEGIAALGPYIPDSMESIEDDCDIPVVVSERSLKRKRRPSATLIKVYEDPPDPADFPERQIRIKEEPSSPIDRSALFPKLARTMTLDLDELGRHINTPRKRQRYEKMLQRSQKSWVPNPHRQERCSSLPAPIKDEPPNDDEQSSQDSIQRQHFGLNRSASDLGIKTEEGANGEPDLHDVKQPHEEATDTASHQTPRALHPLSTNARVLPRTSDWRSNRRQRRDEGRDVQNIHLLSEDGERPNVNGGVLGSQKENRLQRKPEAKSRLVDLLQQPSPEKPTLSAIKTPASTRLRQPPSPLKSARITTPTPSRSSTANSNRPSTTKSTYTTPATSRASSRPSTVKSTSSFRGTHVPLRNRPVSSLVAADFKVNPNFNQGYDYAFSEVVRTRDARRCLPGCTRPECCGRAFRTLAEAGIQPQVPRHLFDSTSEDDDDVQILKDYLGDAFDRERVQCLPEDERQELILQARTRLLADQHGRHRHAYESRRTPPGFWRADMPTTQELEEDRETARQMEKKAIEERYREAMRPGGRWQFRDE